MKRIPYLCVQLGKLVKHAYWIASNSIPDYAGCDWEVENEMARKVAMHKRNGGGKCY